MNYRFWPVLIYSELKTAGAFLGILQATPKLIR